MRVEEQYDRMTGRDRDRVTDGMGSRLGQLFGHRAGSQQYYSSMILKGVV
jgi:hypothetical protein